MQLVTGGGAFTRQNIQQINDNFSAVQNPDIWVRPQYGHNSNNGLSFDNPKATLAGCARLIEPGIVIGLEGVLFEEYSGPIVNDVTIVGMANEPRQATTSGAPNGGGATWLSPSGGTAALLTVNGQSWKVQNVYLNNSSTTNPVIRLMNAGDPPASADAAGFTLKGCTLTGGESGVLTRGGGYLVFDGNTFVLFDTAAKMAIGTESGGVGTGSWTRVINNQFLGNTRHIDAAAHNWEIAYNHFSYISAGVTTTIQVDLTGGSNNSVHDNTFDVPYNQAGLTAMFAAGTDDRWMANTMGTAVLTPMTGRLWGVPTSGAA